MIVYLVDLNQITKDLDSRGESNALSERILKNILSDELEIACQNVIIRRDSYGKPFLVGGKRHFNISYSKNKLVIATDNAPIGVDIEYMKEIDDIDSLAAHFSPEEKNALYQLENSEKIKLFYRLWVLKESYIKAVGKGFSCPLNSFYIEMKNTSATLIYTNEKDLDWKFKSYSLPGGYSSAICARHDKFPKDFIHLAASK